MYVHIPTSSAKINKEPLLLRIVLVGLAAPVHEEEDTVAGVGRRWGKHGGGASDRAGDLGRRGTMACPCRRLKELLLQWR
eukprot:768772-Hanusia_phi.AAC.17